MIFLTNEHNRTYKSTDDYELLESYIFEINKNIHIT